jgi:hypothetical protein
MNELARRFLGIAGAVAAAALSRAEAQDRRWVDPPAAIEAPQPAGEASKGTAPDVPRASPSEAGRRALPGVAQPPIEIREEAQRPVTRRLAKPRAPTKPRDEIVVSREARPRTARILRAHPSFDCRYARSPVELAICADPDLADKDRRMALLYERAGGSRFGPVDPSQWRWLAARNACRRAGPALEACISRAYEDRIAELESRL